MIYNTNILVSIVYHISYYVICVVTTLLHIHEHMLRHSYITYITSTYLSIVIMPESDHEPSSNVMMVTFLYALLPNLSNSITPVKDPKSL